MIEPKSAGTGGALWHARDRLNDCFLVLVGYCWLDINLLDLGCRIAKGDPAIGVIALRPTSAAERIETVEMAGDGIVGFVEQPPQPGPRLISRRAIADLEALRAAPSGGGTRLGTVEFGSDCLCKPGIC
jgi:D-glycero-D-manno-heptose 1,7-bisphosphate phosphatase